MEKIDPVGFAMFAIMVLALIVNVVCKIYDKLFPYKATIDDVESKRRMELYDISMTLDDDYKQLLIEDSDGKDRARRLAFSNPNLKTPVCFHGACLRCKTPSNKGIGTCRGCIYFASNHKSKDLSTVID